MAASSDHRTAVNDHPAAVGEELRAVSRPLAGGGRVAGADDCGGCEVHGGCNGNNILAESSAKVHDGGAA